MALDHRTLEKLDRTELVVRARKLGVERPELLTRVELADEILRVGIPDEGRRRRARGWLGVARDLLASALERRFEMSGAAKLIRGDVNPTEPSAQPPVATVTLAEIYVAQGHRARARAILEEVLAKEPEHEVARRLLDRLTDTPPSPAAEAPSPPRRAAEAPSPPREGPPAVVAAPTSLRATENDSVVMIRLDPLKTFVYWELRPGTVARARERAPRGRAVVKVVSLQPSWDGARRTERLVGAEALQGSHVVDGFGRGSVVRAALGWLARDEFLVFAVASEIALLGDDRRVSTVWAPSPSRVVRGDRPPAPAHLRALAWYRCGAR